MRASQTTELQSLARSRTGSGSVALRARMMLLAGKCESNRQIGIKFDVDAHTVGTWRGRFETAQEEGVLPVQVGASGHCQIGP